MRLMAARVSQLEELLRENGVQLPSPDGAVEHYETCRAVVLAAYELLERLEELHKLVGSGMELLRDSWR